ncbi:MAG: hypothetical protein M9947_01975 [Thermomicrobiales bacterium]|nr:hypothetical protein [Thermomicrobiales bacterium]
MKHYYVTAPGEIGLIEEPIPEPGSGEVQIKVTHTAISPGSNVYIYQTGSYTGEWLGTPSGNVSTWDPLVTKLGAGVVPLGWTAGFAQWRRSSGSTVAPLKRSPRIPDGISPEAASLVSAGWAVSALHLGRYAAAETVAVVGLGLVGASTALVADMMGARVIGIDA